VRALTLTWSGGGSALGVRDLPGPSRADGDVLAETIAVSVCGTDREMAAGARGSAPPDRNWLIIGHESLGRVLESPEGSGLAPGDLVTGVVRRPDPVPCPACATGRPDLCENGLYTERGIRGRDGFASERFRVEADYAVRVDPALGLAGVLVEPASVVAKAWDQLDRVALRPRRRALILGAGPIGLLAALLGVQRGLDVYVADVVDRGPKPRQVRALGASYHASPDDVKGTFDTVVECSGALIDEAVRRTSPAGSACLVSAGGPGAAGLNGLSRDIVRGSKVIMGTVNSSRPHFTAAHDTLLRADREWLEGLLTTHVPLAGWRSAFARDREQIKAVIRFDW
jgi:threonine dehydrogenase-like Zn-dependent dehydrogenase